MYCVCTFTSIHHRAYTCWHLTNNPARWYIKFSLIQTVWRSAVWFSKLSSLHFYASFITFLFCTFENAAQHWLIVLRGLNKLNKWNHFEISRMWRNLIPILTRLRGMNSRDWIQQQNISAHDVGPHSRRSAQMIDANIHAQICRTKGFKGICITSKNLRVNRYQQLHSPVNFKDTIRAKT